MKQSLQLRTSQHLALTPQLQQSIRLLQLSTLELHQELEQILSDNPLLERLDDPLDHSVRLLADGAISSAAGAGRSAAPPAPTDAPRRPTATSGFEGGDGGDERGDRQRRRLEFDDVARTAKAPRRRGRAARSWRRTSSPCASTCWSRCASPCANPRDRALVELVIDALDDNGYLTNRWKRSMRACRQNWKSRSTNCRMRAEAAAKLRSGRRRRAQRRRMPGAADQAHAAACRMVTRRMALTIVEKHLHAGLRSANSTS